MVRFLFWLVVGRVTEVVLEKYVAEKTPPHLVVMDQMLDGLARLIKGMDENPFAFISGESIPVSEFPPEFVPEGSRYKDSVTGVTRVYRDGMWWEDVSELLKED